MSFPTLNVLYFYISTFGGKCAVPHMAVFCSSLILCSPGMSLRYFLSDFEMVPVVPIITCITFVFIFHMCCISFLGSLHFKIFFSFFLITFLSPHTALPINIHLPFPLSQIMSSLLSGMVLSFCTCWFHKMFTLPSWLVTTYCGT